MNDRTNGDPRRPGSADPRAGRRASPGALVLILLLLGVTACGENAFSDLITEPPAPARITLDPAQFTLFGAADSRRISATVLDTAGRPMSSIQVAFVSSDPGVAVVDATGLVQAVGAGSATITASVGDATATAEVVVDFGGIGD